MAKWETGDIVKVTHNNMVVDGTVVYARKALPGFRESGLLRIEYGGKVHGFSWLGECLDAPGTAVSLRPDWPVGAVVSRTNVLTGVEELGVIVDVHAVAGSSSLGYISVLWALDELIHHDWHGYPIGVIGPTRVPCVLA